MRDPLAAGAFALLARRVEEGRSLRNNAAVWSLLGLLAPSAGARARMLARDFVFERKDPNNNLGYNTLEEEEEQ